MNNSPKISVLVPCYNVEKYLEQCIDSITGQTLTDMEIICLNDGSTDRTLEILKGYAGKDSRIVIVDKANSGYGATMNIGLRMAKGKYIAIVESDDYIEPQMFEVMYNEAEKDGLDLVRCLYINRNGVTGKDTVVNDTELYECGRVFNPLEQKKIFLIAPSIWAGLYRRECLEKNDVCFLETPGASYQDASFAFKAYVAAKKMKVVPEVLHNYRINSNSSVNSPGKVFCVCDEEAEIRRYAKEHGVYDELKGIMALRAFGSYKWNYNRLGPLSLKRKFIIQWSKEAKGMFERGEITRKNFSHNRIYRLWHIAYCPWVYYFAKKI